MADYEYMAHRCIPSYLGTKVAGLAEDSGIFSSVQLLLGEVKRAIYPGSPGSNSSNCVEYSVDVEYRQGSGPACTMTFPNCRVINTFGGTADICRYTLRPNPTASPKGQAFGSGSKVLILCLMGERNRGYIIGGVRDDTTTDQVGDGHNYYWEFNGISQIVNKDGEYILQFGGPTKVDGTLDTSSKTLAAYAPTTQSFLKDGSYEIATPKDDQFIRINHGTTKTMELQADLGYTLTTTNGDLNENITGHVNVKSDGVLIGQATDNFPLFSTYRNAESAFHQSLMSALTQVAAQLAVAAAGATGPAAGVAPGLTAAASAMSNAVLAISDFEGQAATYLSKLNKND